MVRKLLRVLLKSDADLSAFCQDYFPDAHCRFTRGMDRLSKVNLLLELIEPAQVLDRLREYVKGDPEALVTVGNHLAERDTEEAQQTWALREKLEGLYLLREQQRLQGQDLRDLDSQIVAVKRIQRQAPQLQEGEILGDRYRLLESVGRGGFGCVWQAFDRQAHRLVALKVYHRRGRAEWERLMVEARTPAQIEHPLVCRVLDLEESLFGLALEYLPAGSVRAILDRGGYDVPRALGLMASAAEGLVAVHAAGFVHRDIKPSNLLLRRDGRVVLTDFGIALPKGKAPTSPMAEGTLQYMPPEQKASAPADPAADVFALGRAANELLAAASGTVPPALASLLGAATREVPRQRPSMQELASALASSV